MFLKRAFKLAAAKTVKAPIFQKHFICSQISYIADELQRLQKARSPKVLAFRVAKATFKFQNDKRYKHPANKEKRFYKKGKKKRADLLS